MGQLAELIFLLSLLSTHYILFALASHSTDHCKKQTPNKRNTWSSASECYWSFNWSEYFMFKLSFINFCQIPYHNLILFCHQDWLLGVPIWRMLLAVPIWRMLFQSKSHGNVSRTNLFFALACFPSYKMRLIIAGWLWKKLFKNR